MTGNLFLISFFLPSILTVKLSSISRSNVTSSSSSSTQDNNGSSFSDATHNSLRVIPVHRQPLLLLSSSSRSASHDRSSYGSRKTALPLYRHQRKLGHDHPFEPVGQVQQMEHSYDHLYHRNHAYRYSKFEGDVAARIREEDSEEPLEEDYSDDSADDIPSGEIVSRDGEIESSISDEIPGEILATDEEIFENEEPFLENYHRTVEEPPRGKDSGGHHSWNNHPSHWNSPQTNFRCSNKIYAGYYADVEAGCHVWHICEANGRQHKFICPNGTLFNQKFRVCDWWFHVDCPHSREFYYLNRDQGLINHYNPNHQNNHQNNHQHSHHHGENIDRQDEENFDPEDESYVYPLDGPREQDQSGQLMLTAANKRAEKLAPIPKISPNNGDFGRKIGKN